MKSIKVTNFTLLVRVLTFNSIAVYMKKDVSEDGEEVTEVMYKCKECGIESNQKSFFHKHASVHKGWVIDPRTLTGICFESNQINANKSNDLSFGQKIEFSMKMKGGKGIEHFSFDSFDQLNDQQRLKVLRAGIVQSYKTLNDKCEGKPSLILL